MVRKIPHDVLTQIDPDLVRFGDRVRSVSLLFFVKIHRCNEKFIKYFVYFYRIFGG